MRVLLTGVSSFTGCWIAEALAAAGTEVVATCRRPLSAYAGLSRRRLDKAAAAGCELLEGIAFGDPAFVATLRSHGPFDLLCHHGAEVGDLRRLDYDPLAALAGNTREAATVLRCLADTGGRGLVVTGSVFEADEGRSGGAAINAYGLAKTLTWQTLRYHAERCGLGLGRFVIPHPFGPLEKPGFTSDLVRSWLAGKPACVRRPDLVRDLVHVDMLAAAYVGLCRGVLAGGVRRSAPSGYVGSLLDQARLFADELRPRLDRPCEVTTAIVSEPGDEPMVRINDDSDAAAGWPADRSWDRYASFHIFGELNSIYS